MRFSRFTLVFCDFVWVSGKPILGMAVTGVGAYLLFFRKTLAEITRGILKLDWKISLKVLKCGFAFWIAQMAMGLIALVYNIQLGKYNGDTAISVYAVISSIIEIPQSIYSKSQAKKRIYQGFFAIRLAIF